MSVPVERFHIYDHFNGYEHIINQVQSLIAGLERASGIGCPADLGIGVPGVVCPSTGRLKNCCLLCLNGHFLKEDLSTAMNTEVMLINDANCFTLAETTLGAARGYNTVMGVILEAGVGSGIVIGGQLLQGLHGIAGEWGHNKMRGSKDPCHCGKKGCNTMVLSEPALEHCKNSAAKQGVAF